MPKWTEYTTKETLADNDEVMLYDATGRANKRGLMSKFWDYVVDKMSTAVISKLETNNKTIIGALNYLNGKIVTASANTEDALLNTEFHIPYPTGLSRNNCFIAGVRCLHKKYDAWYSYFGTSSESISVTLGNSIIFQSSVDGFIGAGAKVEVLLIKK